MKFLIYAGEYDLILNRLGIQILSFIYISLTIFMKSEILILFAYSGNYRWLHALKWIGQKNLVAANMTPYTVDGKVAGLFKSSGPLTFLNVT